MIIDWYTITVEALVNFLQRFVNFIPKLVGALIVLLIGWLIAVVIGSLVAEILKRLGFNKIFEKGAWKESLEKAQLKIDASGFIGTIFKWVIIIGFLYATVGILGAPFEAFKELVGNILSYLPNVVVAVLIFVVAVIIADIVEKIIRASVESAKVGYGSVAGAIVKWSIWIFAIFSILIQLKIAPEMVLTLFTGFVALLALAGGIAFGLGGKDIAAEILESLKKKLQK